MVSIYGGGGGGGFDYVQDPSPQDPSEGEEWFDTGSDRAFVFDGTAWVEMTIGDHGQLSGIESSDHHSRYSDDEARDATDGKIDAETVDGIHAADLETPNSTNSSEGTGSWETVWSGRETFASKVSVNIDQSGVAVRVTVEQSAGAERDQSVSLNYTPGGSDGKSWNVYSGTYSHTFDKGLRIFDSLDLGQGDYNTDYYIREVEVFAGLYPDHSHDL